MKLIALLIGLAVERLATQLFHLRELRWLDRIIDAGFHAAERFAHWPATIPVVLLTVLLALPVFAVMFALGDTLFGFPYLLLAIVVLFFSLGPKDIGEEVDEYCAALESGERETIRATSKALLEKDGPDDDEERVRKVEEAVFVQANNRLFAVIFWFVLFGPLGAWAYRSTDLVRRRAVFSANRSAEDDGAHRIAAAAAALHGWVAWIPARLTAFGYALVGSFDAAWSAWRRMPPQAETTTGEHNEQLLARVGSAALALADDDEEDLAARGVRGAAAANGLVFRLLFLWAVVIAGLTLYGWSV
ncbi:MAG TPA: regulatory signaling modulator protein AmpE [Woeseiaceae bacterium]|nr:regulatory signaling modulator protein AmpE [Woeseiaceae bacterium]